MACAFAGALLLGSGGCTGADDEGAPDVEAAVQTLFDRQAAAVLDGDASRYLATVDTRSRDYRERQRLVAGNLARLPLADWSYNVRSVDRRGDRAQAEVELSYRLRHGSRPPVVAEETFELRRHDGDWYIAGEDPGGARWLWEQGRLKVLRGEHSLVLGTVDRPALRRIAARAERAVTAVSDAWPEPWPRRTVVLVPTSVRDMARLLHGEPATYEGIAAVTTGPPDGEAGELQRIIVNRQAYALLSDRGRQVVVTHETAHVATAAHTGDSTPLWLSEGLADWFGYRGTGTDPVSAAPTLARSVHAGALPDRLPPDSRFRFTGDADELARAYEGAWLACRMIAEHWGADRLTAFYVALGADPEAGTDGRTEAVDRALRDVLDTDRAVFTRMWRSYLRTQLTR